MVKEYLDTQKLSKTPHTTKYIEVQCFQFLNITEQEELTDIDILKFNKYCKSKNILPALIHGIAPSIWGYETIKLALLMQTVSGTANQVGRIKIRGDIHILLLGDPGTAKSQLLHSWYKLVDGTYSSGTNATSVGLTAALSRDSQLDCWTLEGGAFILAHKNYLAIDELDKFSRSEISALHEPMQQQTVTISKAGTHIS